ncbi:MAG TPA: methyltransferase, partial [Chloroflexota bacterium]|nr:methyltransferase [Chloroflexota bacterium]
MSFELPLCDDRLLWDSQLSVNLWPALLAADELGIFRALADAPASPAELAERLEVTERGAAAMLAILAAQGLLASRGGRYDLTPTARSYLLPGSEFYWGGVFEQARRGGPPTPEAIISAMRGQQSHGSGNSPFSGLPGEAPRQLKPESAPGMVRFQHSHTFPAAQGVARHADFRGVRSLIDIAGGSGGLAIAIALAHPDMHCAVGELPPVCELARGYIEHFGLAGRVEAVELDMLAQPCPDGFDAVLFSNVLHDWEPFRCLELLRKAFDAVPAGGRVYVHETLLDDGRDGPAAAASLSLRMMLGARGSQ